MSGEVSHSPRSRPVIARLADYVQLSVAILLTADLSFTWAVHGLTRAQMLLLGAALLWLGAGFVFLLHWQHDGRKNKYEDLLRYLTCSYARVDVAEVIVVLVLVELGWRVFVPSSTKYIYPPNQRHVVRREAKFTPGASGDAVTSINEWGMRGRSVRMLAGKTNVLKIITIGGSTTICEYLDDSESWPQLLMDNLNSAQKQRFVYVANAGVSGHNTADHLELLHRFPVVQQADMLIFLIGVNDVESALALEGRSGESDLVARASTTSFEEPPRYPLYTRLRLYQLVETARVALGLKRAPNGADWYGERRRVRAQSTFLPPPNVDIPREEYRLRCERIAKYCRSTGQRCVFLTQPTIWRSELTATEESLIWLGWVGRIEAPKGFVRASDLATIMNRFNQTLLDVCRTDELECYDLASAIPKETFAFFDDAHFSPGGAKLVARFLADHLLKTEPFQASKAVTN